MREFAKIEIIDYKCHTCGCRNKMYTEMMSDGKKVGFKLTCCNCGEVLKFYDDSIKALETMSGGERISVGRAFCIQPHFCPHKECPLYGTYRDDWDNDADIPMDRKPSKNSGNSNKILDYEQLTVKDLPNPRFKYFCI